MPAYERAQQHARLLKSGLSLKWFAFPPSFLSNIKVPCVVWIPRQSMRMLTSSLHILHSCVLQLCNFEEDTVNLFFGGGERRLVTFC